MPILTYLIQRIMPSTRYLASFLIALAAGCSSGDDASSTSSTCTGAACGTPDAGSGGAGGAPVDPTAGWKAGTGPLVSVSGKTFVFGPNSNGETLEGATVSVAEAPEYKGTVAADGTFSLQVPTGAPLSFQLQQTGFHPNQSATLPVDPAGVDMLGFQAPTEETFNLLATVAQIHPKADRCQITTTVSRAGTAPYGGSGLGEPDVVVSIDPLPPEGATPIYFQYFDENTIYPDPALTATTIDGGVIFANIPPGEYTLNAVKQDKQFTPVTIRCRAGVLVNAAPPHGLQEI